MIKNQNFGNFLKNIIKKVFLLIGRTSNDSFVVVYHEVSPLQALGITPEKLEKQIKYWIDKGYAFSTEAKELKKPKNIILTFDDVFDSFEEYVLPILKKQGVPAIIFPPTEYLGKKFTDGISYEASQKKKIISSESLKRIYSSGLIKIGCHTHTHPILTEKDEQTVKEEIKKSAIIIKSIARDRCDYFCYPKGKTNLKVTTIVKNSGFKNAFTTEQRTFDKNKDLFNIPRFDGMQFLDSLSLKLSTRTTINAYFELFVKKFGKNHD